MIELIAYMWFWRVPLHGETHFKTMDSCKATMEFMSRTHPIPGIQFMCVQYEKEVSKQ